MLTCNDRDWICQKLLEQVKNSAVESTNPINQFSIQLDKDLKCEELLDFFTTEKKVYFKSVKLNTEFLALGQCHKITGRYLDLEATFNKVERLQKEFSGNIYSALAFSELNKNKDQHWSKFNEVEFFIPVIEFVKHKSLVTVNLMLTKDQLSSSTKLEALIHEILAGKVKNKKRFPKLISEKTIPSKSKWTENINRVLDQMKKAELVKVVLARKSLLTFENSINAAQLMQEMMDTESLCSIVYFQINKNTTYLAVTPESLFSRNNDQINADVLAGTTRVGDTLEETDQFARLLQKSNKDKIEHNEVLNYIENKLNDISNSVTIKDELSILKLSKVQHLKSVIQATLNDNISDLTVLKKLHPTPAIGGVPQQSTLNLIKSMESFNRGLFAGAIGVISQNVTDIAVGIRSCLIHENELCLFVGSGILEESCAENEWEELNRKVLNYKDVFALC